MQAKEFPKKDDNLYSHRPEDAIHRILSIILEFFDTKTTVPRNYQTPITERYGEKLTGFSSCNKAFSKAKIIQLAVEYT